MRFPKIDTGVALVCALLLAIVIGSAYASGIGGGGGGGCTVGCTFSGTTNFAGGTIAASAPGIDLTQTWNAGGTNFKAIVVNVTDTASAANSTEEEWQDRKSVV